MTRKTSLWKPLVLVVVLIIFVILAQMFNLGERLGDLRGWIISLGALGPVVYVLIYAGAVVFAIPASVLSVLAGILFGSFLGVILVSMASTTGAALSFLLSRYMARDYIVSKFMNNEKFLRLDQMTKEHGAIFVAITRLIPLFPFPFLNYGFGLTHIPFWTYVFWSWLCMLPWTIIFVVGADTVTQAVSKGEIPYLLIGILVFTIVIITILVRKARKSLSTKEQ